MEQGPWKWYANWHLLFLLKKTAESLKLLSNVGVNIDQTVDTPFETTWNGFTIIQSRGKIMLASPLKFFNWPNFFKVSISMGNDISHLCDFHNYCSVFFVHSKGVNRRCVGCQTPLNTMHRMDSWKFWLTFIKTNACCCVLQWSRRVFDAIEASVPAIILKGFACSHKRPP